MRVDATSGPGTQPPRDGAQQRQPIRAVSVSPEGILALDVPDAADLVDIDGTADRLAQAGTHMLNSLQSTAQVDDLDRAVAAFFQAQDQAELVVRSHDLRPNHVLEILT